MGLIEYHKNDLICYEIEKYPMFEILYLRVLKNSCNDEEVTLNCDVLETFIKNRVEKNKCFYLFYDVKHITNLIPMKYIYSIIKMFKNNNENIKKGLIKTFIINSSMFVIGISKLVLTIYTPTRPYEFVKNCEEAKEKLFKLNN